MSRRVGFKWARSARLLLALLFGAASSVAQPSRIRNVLFEWDTERHLLYLTLNYRDVIDSAIQGKLRRGLPVTLVLSAAIYLKDTTEPISTTAQTCKVTWHVWEEAYRIELSRPGQSQVRWSPTAEGVLRRCAEVNRLFAGDGSQIPENTPLYASGKIQINPISPELVQKLRRWVMRPSGTGTAAPGDALFSTFTGLFLQRIGDAEKQEKFVTQATLPLPMPLETP